MSSVVALRDCGEGVIVWLFAFNGSAPVMGVSTDGKTRAKPLVFATEPVNMPAASSGKNTTGAHAYATVASLTMLFVKVERRLLLIAMRFDVWLAANGKPGNAGS